MGNGLQQRKMAYLTHTTRTRGTRSLSKIQIFSNLASYTGRKTQKKRSLVFHVAPYNDEFIVVPGCFGELPNWWRNFRTESQVDLFYQGQTLECLARTIEHDETDAVPRLAEYVRHFHADLIGITPETTEDEFNELVTAAANMYPIVTIRPRLRVSDS